MSRYSHPISEEEKDAIALGVLRVVQEVARMTGQPGRRVPRPGLEATGCVVDPMYASYVYEAQR